VASQAAGGGYTDPYATPKANLRDTIKWMASIFAALAAVVIAGTPISNLGSPSLTLGQQVTGVVALLACFVCICAAIVLMLRLLRADLVYLTDIDPREALGDREDGGEIAAIRKDIGGRKVHFFPDYASLEDFFDKAGQADASAQDLGNKWLAAMAAGEKASIDAAKEAYANQVTELEKFEGAQQDMLAYAAYLRFYSRIRSATRPLLLLGAGALLALLVFTIVIQAKKEDSGPSVVVVPVPGEPVSVQTSGAQAAGTIFFETGSAAVGATGLATLERVRDALLAKPDTALLIISRTDTIGTERRNKKLARQRAEAVRNLIVARGGVAATRVFATEAPKSDLPELTNDDVERRANRSASLYLVPIQAERLAKPD
jgi:outer membrane protein OmpA-like peptidoglycan-associated protein